MQAFSPEVVVTRLANAQTAATTGGVSATALDMAGYDGVAFLVQFGAVASGSVVSIAARQGTATSTASMASVASTGSTASASNDFANKVFLLDIKPSQRYVDANITVATQNALVESVVAIQYKGRKIPVSQSSSVAATASGLGG